jgi:hypothetical protein
MNSDIINSDKLLFVCANPGSGGYRLGRILSCFNNVFWYSNGRNGHDPWLVYVNNRVSGKQISENHYDRYIGHQMVPLAGKRIECYWNDTDLDYFYNNVWSDKMLSCGATAIIKNNMYISWIVHDTPQYIRNRFPNAKIVNLIDTNISQVSNRYVQTTALYPAFIKNSELKPTYDTKHTEILKYNPNPTYRDLWMWNTYKEATFSEFKTNEYLEYVNELLYTLNQEKKIENPNYFSLTWDSLSVDSLRDYLKSTSIDIRFNELLV